MKLLHVNLFLKDMSLSLLCEHKKSLFLLWKLLFKMHRICIFWHNFIPVTSHVIWPTHIMFYSSVSHVKCLACYSNTEWDTYYIFHYHTGYVLHNILELSYHPFENKINPCSKIASINGNTTWIQYPYSCYHPYPDRNCPNTIILLSYF